MKRNSKIVLSIILLVSILTITGIVNAFSVSMKLESSSKLKVGDIVEVTLKISNIDAGNGIDAISGTLEYDKNVFDEVTQESFVGINSWNIGMYDTTSKIFTVLRGSKVNTIGDVLKVSLRVKSVTGIEDTTIKINEISASGGAVSDGGTGDIEIAATEVKIAKAEIGNLPITNTEKPGSTTNEVTNTTTNIITNNITNTTNKKPTTTTTTGKLPQTGEGFGLIVAVFLVTIISITSYIKYRNVKIK